MPQPELFAVPTLPARLYVVTSWNGDLGEFDYTMRATVHDAKGRVMDTQTCHFPEGTTHLLADAAGALNDAFVFDNNPKAACQKLRYLEKVGRWHVEARAKLHEL